MTLKAFPSEFKPLTIVIIQRDETVAFSEFNVALSSFKETEKLTEENNFQNTVMTLKM